jgi:hypothetical protein
MRAVVHERAMVAPTLAGTARGRASQATWMWHPNGKSHHNVTTTRLESVARVTYVAIGAVVDSKARGELGGAG